MRHFQDTFKTRKRTCTSAFSVCMTVPLPALFLSASEQIHSKLLRILSNLFKKFGEIGNSVLAK